jgi:AraC-like DNA-binding protein
VHPDTLSERRRLYLLGRVVVSRYYRRPLTLAAVARAISTSPRQLQRAYAQFDDSFHEDLLARRMTVAAQMLAEQRTIAVCDVARLVGYRNCSHFTLAFRRRYKLSPAQFRERAIRHAALSAGTVPDSESATRRRARAEGSNTYKYTGPDSPKRGRAGPDPRRSASSRPRPAPGLSLPPAA